LIIGFRSSTIGRMSERDGGYKPYTDEQWQKIHKLWDIYKADIGLEGELCMELTREGKSAGEIAELVEKHRKETEENLEIWHTLRITP